MGDPLDSSDFDPVSYINEYFPTESSLDTIDTYIVGLNSKIGALEEEISKSVQIQSHAGQEATKEIHDAQIAINDLVNKIQDIKSKASQSERMVQEICADIKKLDFAKTHLQSSITALKRLQMLITAVNKLEVLAQEYQYKEVANLLDAVKQLMAHFDQYTDIPLIFNIKGRIDMIQSDLQKQVHRAFREIGQLVDSVADVSVILQSMPGHLRSISDACLVVDSLGNVARRELLVEFVDIQLVPYELLFGLDKPHCTLEEVDRRWAWFKRLLKSVETKFSKYCPSHWRIPLRLCMEFIQRTKDHLHHILLKLESNDTIDVSLLLKALQTAARFEQEMDNQFESIYNQVGLLKYRKNISLFSTASTDISGTETSSTNPKNTDKFQGIELTFPEGTPGIDNEEKEFLINAFLTLKGSISCSFDRFLGSYVKLEKTNLEELLKRLSQEEDTTRATGSTSADESTAVTTDVSSSTMSAEQGHVYGSSVSMFVFIKNSIKRCIGFSTGQSFLLLSKEFKVCLHQYADLLRQRCPPLLAPPTLLTTTSSTSNNTTSFTSSSNYFPHPLCKLISGQENVVCYVINTGEYCAEVIPQLEQMIKTKINDPYKDKVDFSIEIDVYHDVISIALKALIGGTLDRLELAFKSLTTQNWGLDAQVGEESPYVLQISVALNDIIPRIRDYLSPTYFTTFCTRLSTEVLLRYQDILMRQKLISEAGSQQLLLDTYNLKTVLLHLHTLGSTSGTTAEGTRTSPQVYIKFVTTRASQIETILKLVGTPKEMLIERFRIMWAEGRMDDLLTIMALKGMNKKEQQSLLEINASIVSTIPVSTNTTTNTVQSPTAASSSLSSSSTTIATSSLLASSSTAVSSSSAAVASASMVVASSMGKLTQDLSTSLSAVGNLKWVGSKNNTNTITTTTSSTTPTAG